MDMPTPMPGMGNSTHHHMDMGDHFMYMWFHTDPKNTILFGFWNTHNGGEIGYSCVIIFFLSIFLELVKYARWRFDVYTAKKTDFYEKKYFHQLIEMYHISQTLLYGIQTLTMYFVMLVFMTFSIWLCISIVCGLSIGHYMFGIRRSPVDTVDPLQLNDDTYILNTTGYQRSLKMSMKMYFHFRLNEPVLFRQWVPGNTAGYIFTCLAVFAIALTFELLRYFHNGFLRKVYLGEKEGSFHDCCHMPGEHSRISPDLPFKVKYLFRAFNIISPVLYFMEMYLSYSLMLVSMTYNVPFVASLLAGHILGYYLVGSKMSLSQDDEQADCCA